MVYAGDLDPSAACLARYNARLNGVPDRVDVAVLDARETILRARRIHGRPLHVSDLDPFGSPAPFVDVAVANTAHRGLFAATATDLAVLEGGKPRAARRRYGVDIVKVPESKEIAIRVLLAFIARAAALHDRSIRPLLSFYADHYVRVALLVERGAKRADRMLEESIGYATYCPGDKRTYLGIDASCMLRGSPIRIGPLWTGRLNDPDYIESVLQQVEEMEWLGTRDRARRLLETLRAEAPLEEGLHIRIEQAASTARVSMPRKEKLLEALRGQGYQAVPSHYSPTAFRTDAPYSRVIEVLLALASSSSP